MLETAKDISWRAHIHMQAAFQKHVHNAVSKTINMKNECTVDDVYAAYIMAFDTKCKGVTIYRDGSRDEQVLSSIERPVGEDSIELDNKDNERPKSVSGKTTKCTSGCGSLFVTTNVVDGKPYELFVHHSDGGCQSNMEAIGRLISLALKDGIEVDEIVGQLSKIKCSNAIRSSKSEGDSCSQIIGKQLIESLKENSIDERSEGLSEIVQGSIEHVPTIDDNEFVNYSNKCPECGEKLNFGEGCGNGMCMNCGWSGCS